MSSTDSPLENILEKEEGIAIHSTVQLVSLNEAFQQVLKRYTGTGRGLVVRCEALPKCEAGKDQIAEVFECLFSAVFDQPFIGSKLFLYISCREKAEQLTLNKQGFKTYEVLVHTNIETDDGWRARMTSICKNSEKLLTDLNASISLSSLTNKGGCLFIISLQGKY